MRRLTWLLWLIAILLTIDAAFATARDWFFSWRVTMSSPNEPPKPPTVTIVRISVLFVAGDKEPWKVLVHTNNGCRWKFSEHMYEEAAQQQLAWVGQVLIAGCPKPPTPRHAS